jgi:hypothetical protein
MAEGSIKLHIKGIKSVQVSIKGGIINLLNVLYVPDLGINLFSGTALYEKGLRGSFNKLTLYIHNKKGSLVLKAIK